MIIPSEKNISLLVSTISLLQRAYCHNLFSQAKKRLINIVKLSCETFFLPCASFTTYFHSWDLVAHSVTQVIGEQALVDILDLSEVAWTCWGVFTPRNGLGLKMVKELDLQLALGMNEKR